MKSNYKHIALVVLGSAFTLLTLTSCVVEAVALAAIADDLNKEKPELPPLIMHDGAQGKHPVARTINGSSTLIADPYTNKPINVYGLPAGKLMKSPGFSRKKFYIPRLSQFPTAKKVASKPGSYINPYDSREIQMGSYKAGALVASPTVGTFFYLEN